MNGLARPVEPAAPGVRVASVGATLALRPETFEPHVIVGEETSLGGSAIAPPAGSAELVAPGPEEPGGSPPGETGETEVAALTPGTEGADAPNGSVLPEAPEARPALDLPRAVQGELARLGCYSGAVDGIWGPNSAGAAERYYDAKGEAPDALDPDQAFYARLLDESGQICKPADAPKAAKPQQKVAPKAAAPARKAAPKADPKPPKRSRTTTVVKRTPPPAAPPPPAQASSSSSRIKPGALIGGFR
ncbi:hypothetical protein E4O86_22850 [Rhizobiales bacterium L72]|uniref:Peptidoglycan-binding protein n=1 Tax=Propylenella binzhouense TaxID=2555902 RepID=A0A964WW60_9HYPH|nr:hypothetical protein [Propylenella binzhouense]